MIPEGSSIQDFWASHTSGYLEFTLVDEEDEGADDSFLESPKNETDELAEASEKGPGGKLEAANGHQKSIN